MHSEGDFFGGDTVNHLIYVALVPSFLLFFSPAATMAQRNCPPTASDAEGPFYKASAPIRENTGRGLTVNGTVRSAGSCTPIPGARLEWWLANGQGSYDDEHRGALVTAEDGDFQFETDFPPAYFGRPPHVHVKVFAPGHRTLTTQIYPEQGRTAVALDLVVPVD
jgi:protocatechuate 3,4-dioxygenase beta subunit